LKTKYYILLISIFTLTSCSITKTKKSLGIDTEKNEQKFVYLFSEANKNRLLGKTQKAVEYYMSALDINPKSAASNYYLASLFMGDKNYETAITFAKKASNLNNQNLWYKLLEADIIYSQNNIDEAYTKFLNLHNKYPHNELLYERIIDILLNKIKIKSEKSTFNDLIFIYKEKQKHFGFDTKISEYLYNIYSETKDTKNAILELEELIKNNPDNPKYKAFMAENYVKTGQQTKSEEIFKILNKKYPKNIDVKLSYLKYCKFYGKQNEYFLTVKQLLNSNLKFNDKVHLIISGRHPNFPPKLYEELLNILQQNHPNEILTNTLITEFYIENDKEKAIPYLIKATNLSKGDFNLILTLFELAYDSKKYEILYKQSKKYLELYPNQAKIFLYNGIGSYKTGRFKEAISVLNIGKDFVIEDNQLLLQFHFYLAETYHSINENKKSDEQFDKVLSINPKFYLALNNYSYYLSERNINLQKALLMAQSCLKFQAANPVFNDTYARALLNNKQYKKALLYSEKAIKIIANNIQFLENYGDILFANGKKNEALINWKYSQKLGNNSEKLNNKIKNFSKIRIEDL